ncbi:UNVERIFIED_CONTAM: hypothetical protein GTU68_056013 [Idotea baltica]|nr:hypothetical protein [Idotea baltica]
MSDFQATIDEVTQSEYKWGFVSELNTETIAKGLSEDVVRLISSKKEEPEWMLNWRLKAYKQFCKMQEPDWAKVNYEKPDLQDIIYYAEPKPKKQLNSLDELDPELKTMYDKLGISINEQKRLANVAVDIVIDSVSVTTTFKETLGELGIIFCSFSEAVKNHPELVKKHIGSVVPVRDNYYAALNSAVFSDGSFCHIPKGVRCPMELSTYFRINEANTGQFERTLIVCEDDGYVSYLEGCTAPIRDENQLHAAVVEIIAGTNSEVKYSTRGICKGANSKISWTQVETGSAVTWKYPSVILQGDNSIDAKNAYNFSQCDSLLIGDKCGAHTFPYIEASNSTSQIEHEATTSKIGEDILFYCNQRGIDEEKATELIVHGFVKEVMDKLPMEFAVEAKKLLAITLEGSVG